MRRCVPACVNMGVRMWVVRACVLCACGRQRVPVRGRVECVHTGVCECETVDRPCAWGWVGVRCGDSAAPCPRAPGESGARRHRRGLPAAPRPRPRRPRGPWVTPGQPAAVTGTAGLHATRDARVSGRRSRRRRARPGAARGRAVADGSSASRAPHRRSPDSRARPAPASAGSGTNATSD